MHFCLSPCQHSNSQQLLLLLGFRRLLQSKPEVDSRIIRKLLDRTRAASSAAVAAATPRQPWEREAIVQENANRFLLAQENVIKEKVRRKQIDQSSLFEFLRHAGPNDFQISCSAMNRIYNSGTCLSDAQLPSNLLGLCIDCNWLDEALDLVNHHHGWFERSLSLNDHLLLMARFSQRNDIHGVMTVFNAARTNWQVPLDGKIYDIALASRLACEEPEMTAKDASVQPQTRVAPNTPDDADKEAEIKKKLDERLKEKRDRATEKVLKLFGSAIPQSTTINDLFCDLLMIYSDGVEMGVRMGEESHCMVLRKVCEELKIQQQTLKQNWDQWIDQNDVKSVGKSDEKKTSGVHEITRYLKDGRRFLEHIREEDCTGGALVALRLMYTAFTIHDQLFKDFPSLSSNKFVFHPPHQQKPAAQHFPDHQCFSNSLVSCLNDFYSTLQNTPTCLRLLSRHMSVSQVPRCQRKATNRSKRATGLKHRLAYLGTDSGLNHARATLLSYSPIIDAGTSVG